MRKKVSPYKQVIEKLEESKPNDVKRRYIATLKKANYRMESKKK